MSDRLGLSVQLRDPDLAERIERAVRGALADAFVAPVPPPAAVPVSRPGEAAGVPAGAIAIVRVTASNVRGLSRLVSALEARGAAGIQLVWDGVAPPREDAEGPIFRLLERRRAGQGVPLVLSRFEEPSWVLVRSVRPGVTAP